MSSPSLRPTGATARAEPEPTYESLSAEWSGEERRRRLSRIVFTALGVCAVILAAALVRKVTTAVASDAPHDAPALPALAVAASVAPASPEPSPAPAVAPAPTTGTLVLDAPASVGRVWIDGQKVSAVSSSLDCGTHEIRIGTRGKTHAIDIPCGKELRVSR